tara:strand:+ start:110 stop:958 length:849 start_codon:yes stop_codon:yes gene_type:complete
MHSIKKYFKAYYKSSLIIIITISTFGFINTLYLDSVFMSSVTLEPKKSIDSSNQNKSFNSLGASGLASSFFGGIDKSSDVSLALEVLKSRDFFESLLSVDNFKNEINNPIKTNYFGTYQFNSSDEMQQFDNMHARFINEHLSFTQQEKTGFVTIRISHYDKIVAKKWLDLVIEKLNKEIKELRLNESKKILNFLQKQISLQSLPEIRSSLAGLITNEIRTIGLSSIDDDFVFKVIDKPRVPDNRSRPSRSINVIVWFLFSIIAALTVTLLQIRFLKIKIKIN